jgi:hypothetical protein
MKFYFHPHAEAELYEAICYYEKCQIGLGLEMPKKFTRRFDEHPNILKLSLQCRRTRGGAL